MYKYGIDAKKINLENYEQVITGNELEKMSDEELFEAVKTVNIFATITQQERQNVQDTMI